MPSKTVIQCDCGCKREIELGEAYVAGAEKLLQIKDARGVSYWLLSVDCLKTWLSKYTPLAAPDINAETEEPIPDEAMPEFEN